MLDIASMSEYTMRAMGEKDNNKVAIDFTQEEALVSEYSRIVKACARPYYLAGGDAEDLIQEGMLGLISAIRTFDLNKGTKFSTYAELCVRRRIYSAIRAASGNKHSPLNSYISLESPELDETTTTFSGLIQNPEVFVIERERVSEVERLLSGTLSVFESAVLSLFLEGRSYKEMAAILKKTEKSVDNAVQRIRKKLAQSLK